MEPWIALTLIALVGLLVSERSGSQRGKWIAKPLASTGFLLAAWSAGALDSGYGQLIGLGLALSFWGDVFLIPKGRPAVFRAGIGSFLLGHVAYAVAFGVHGASVAWVLGAGALLVIPVGIVLRWLMPHVGPDMLWPIRAYVGVISVMLALAVGAVAAGGDARIGLGALAFYLSDLAVARDRFVVPGFQNAMWGLPLYYVAQLLLAATV